MNNVLMLEGVGGQRISLWLGDLTESRTDAIVNAANDRLAHGGGAAGDIVKKGGPGIQIESDFIGGCKTGSAVVTGGGWLPARWVIHAVGPIGDSNPQHDQDLINAVWASLMLAHRLGCRSIAIPPISAGIFGFPKARCAQLLLYAVQNWCEQFAGKTNLTDIRFLTNTVPTLDIFHAVMSAAEGHAGPVSTGQQAGTQPALPATPAGETLPFPPPPEPAGAELTREAVEEPDETLDRVTAMFEVLGTDTINRIVGMVEKHLAGGGSAHSIEGLAKAVALAQDGGAWRHEDAQAFVLYVLETTPVGTGGRNAPVAA